MAQVVVALVIGSVGLGALAWSVNRRASLSPTRPRMGARRAQRTVEVGPGAPIPIPLGWGPEDDDEPVRPPRSGRSTRAHPTMRLTHR